MGFIPELEHFPPLAGEVGTRVQRADSLVADLHNKAANKPINTSPRKLDGAPLRGRERGKREGIRVWSASSAVLVPFTHHPSLLHPTAGALEYHCCPTERERRPHTGFPIISWSHLKEKKVKK